MKVYLAWWKFYDPFDGCTGLLGIYSTLEAAEKACKLHIATNDDDTESGLVTEVEIDSCENQFNALNGYKPISEFFPSQIEE